ncbi:hypothetical protein [Flavobacterium sp.]|uniref:hypothetical protein n=1 Tax=Flavobacterium sp. TaxID=239 RepID=UPI002602A00C|nr:hypothetical protein [Flavobacterium sp.]
MKEDQWIEMVLNSTNGITKVNPDEELFSKIEQKLKDKPVVQMRTMWFAAASIIVFLSLNVFLLSSETTKKEASLSAFSSELEVDNQLYK